MAAGRLDVAVVHGPHGAEGLRSDTVHRSPTLGDVAHEATRQTKIGRGVDEDLEVQERAELRPPKREQPVYQHGRFRVYRIRPHARVARKRIARLADALARRAPAEVIAAAREGGSARAGCEPAKLIEQQRKVEGARLVVVDRGAFGN